MGIPVRPTSDDINRDFYGEGEGDGMGAEPTFTGEDEENPEELEDETV